MHRRTDSKHGASKGKRRKVIEDEMLSSESTINEQSEDESVGIDDLLGLHKLLFENRKPRWDALFEKYELKSEDDLDSISLANESGRLKEHEFRYRRSAMKLKNWHEGFNSSSISSEDQNQQPAEVEAVEENEDIGTAENAIIDERAVRKSGSMINVASHIGEKDKIKSVKKDINRNVYQLRSRKNREGNFEKERRNDISQGFISNGIIKKHQEGTNNFDQLHQHENSRMNDSHNESNNIVEIPIIDERPARKSRSVFSGASDIGKKDKIKSVKKDINQIVNQLDSRQNREGNFEKERRNDMSQGFITNGLIKKHQESTNNFERLHQYENSRVNDPHNESNNIVENPIIDECPARKSRSVVSRASDIGKKDKIKSVKKDIDRNVYQLRFRQNRDGNLEKERRNDVSQGSNGFVKKHQESTREGRTFQNTNNFERLHQHENSRVNDTHNDSDNKSYLEVHLEKQELVKKGLLNPIILSKHIPEEMKKENSNRDLKFLKVKNISQNLPHTKLGTALQVNKQNYVLKNETYENTAHCFPLSDLNFSIHSIYSDSKDFSLQAEKTFEKQESKNIQSNNSVMFPKEMGREISDWSTEFSNFIKYRWNDFQKNPGSMLFPLPKLKSSGRDEKLSWENIMNGN